MKGYLLLLPVLAAMLTGCDTIKALECNKQAVKRSTQAICENIHAIEQANQAIDENRRQLEAINESLKHVGQESN